MSYPPSKQVLEMSSLVRHQEVSFSSNHSNQLRPAAVKEASGHKFRIQKKWPEGLYNSMFCHKATRMFEPGWMCEALYNRPLFAPEKVTDPTPVLPIRDESSLNSLEFHCI